ncbi:MAG: hypothetical protein MUO39_01190 [Steroidobacteraceae bacterium]|nr:hypothetical protein [Steroidobacteraceae bacterium]
MTNHARVLSLMLMASVTASAAAEDAPEAPALDARVEATLKAASLPFTSDGGDFRLNYTLPDGRTQLVWISSKTTKIADTEFRDVWSVANRGQGALPAELADHLLKENVRMVLGAWQVSQGEDEYLVVFSYAIPAETTPGFLQEVIEAVTISADRMEKELTGRDEF